MNLRLLTLVAAAVLAACHNYHPRTLPSVPSPQPAPRTSLRNLYAGLGRADLTPPPGVGLQGYGQESRRARGYRHRLYARTLLLEDAAGERVAFVVADLHSISPLLHRLVAARIVETTSVGSDRLILSATHTHSGPNHYFAAKLYNDYGSSVPGYDTLMVEFLVDGIASAVRQAATRLRPARIAWGRERVWGHTRNRSYPAFLLNDPPADLPGPPPGLELSDEERAIDPTWTMLRVDLLDAGSGEYRPAGALSVFGIHGTGIPAATDLFDGDVFALAERGLELHIDSLNHRTPGFGPEAVHLVANGTSGDVSPAWPAGSRCRPPGYGSIRRPGGPRMPPAAEGFKASRRDSVDACLSLARGYAETAGRALAGRAIALFDRLGPKLSGDVEVARRFRTVRVRGDASMEGLCPKPRMGTAALGGAEDGYTRYYGWRFLGLIPIGYEEGRSAVKEKQGDCQAPKRTALYPVQDLVAGPHGFPEWAQLAVIRVGGGLIGAVPAEVTVTAGARMRSAMARAAAGHGMGGDSVVLITLANGYLQYVTTPEEYTAQHYEGASTIYGPGTASVFQSILGDLVAELREPGGAASTPGDTIIAYPGAPRAIFPARTTGPGPNTTQRRFEKVECIGDTVMVRWIDAHPGRQVPADGPVLRIERRIGIAEWQTVAWDDDPRVEVRAISPRGRDGYEWEALWSSEGISGEHRFVLSDRGDLPETRGEPFPVCPYPWSLRVSRPAHAATTTLRP